MIQSVRSCLYLPASNARAVDKARTLDCDVAILDLEDAVAPDMKTEGRAAALAAIRDGGFGPRLGVRINGLDTEWGEADLEALAATDVSLVIAPKIESAEAVRAVADRLPAGTDLWVMIETPAAVLRLDGIGGAGGCLSGLMLGVNDLSKGLGTRSSPDREPLKPWMAATVAAARAHGLLALDGVFNALDDATGLAAECAQGALYGFDGKSLIHPSQIAATNAAFSVSEPEAAHARAIVEAFAAAPDQGALRVNGGMVERLHLEAAQVLLARHAAETAPS